MATIIQVTGTGFDSNVWGLVPDNDGTTCWAFLDTAVGNTTKYARFSLTDGSIVHAGNLFGGSGYINNRTNANVFWAQDNGKYYTLSKHTGTVCLYQFQVGSSAGGSSEVLDTYSTGTVSFNLNGAPLGFNANEVYGLTAWTQGSNHYVAVIGGGSLGNGSVAVLNADTMTLIGYNVQGTQPVSPAEGAQIFADKNGDFWIMQPDHTGTSVHFVYWHPANGASANVLNVTDNVVSMTTIGFTNASDACEYSHYNPVNHSVTLGNYGVSFPQYATDLSNLSLTTFTQNTFRANDGSFFFNNIDSNSPNDATDLEFTIPNQPSGKFAMESDTTGSLFNTQVGGILNIIDPVALTSYSTFNVTQAILGASVPAPPQETGFSGQSHGTGPSWYDPFASMVYSETSQSLAVTYGHLDFSTGSALYLVVFSPPVPPTIFAQVVPATINKGGTATLSWVSTNASSVTIAGIGSVALSGSMSVSPSVTNTYQFTATGSGGTATTSVTLTVLSISTQFSLQKMVLTLKKDPNTPRRGKS